MPHTPVVHEFPYRVRYADTDTMHFMYNGQYLTLFEIGRTELLRANGLPYVELERAGYMLPVMEAHVKYLLPAFYDDLLTIETTFTASARATITLHYRILRGDELVAEGHTVHCFMRSDTRAVTRPPRVFMDVFA